MCFYLARCFVNMTFMTRSEHPNKAHCIPYRGERTDNTTTADTSTRRHDDGDFGEARRLEREGEPLILLYSYFTKKAIYERETRALTASPSTLFRKTSPTRKTT